MNHISPLCNHSFSFVLEAIGFPIWFCMFFVCTGVEANCTKHLRISSALCSPLAISFRSPETRDPDPWRGSCWHCWPSWRSGKGWNEAWFFSLMLRVILEFWRAEGYVSHFFHIHSICSVFFSMVLSRAAGLRRHSFQQLQAWHTTRWPQVHSHHQEHHNHAERRCPTAKRCKKNEPSTVPIELTILLGNEMRWNAHIFKIFQLLWACFAYFCGVFASCVLLWYLVVADSCRIVPCHYSILDPFEP